MTIRRQETIAFQRWAERHPNWCRACDGSGISFEDLSVNYTEPCGDCQGYGKCPQCGWTTYDERANDFTDECPMCGWEWNDWLTMPPPRYEWVDDETGGASVYILNDDLYERSAA